MGFNDFACDIQTQSQASRLLICALVVCPPRQGIEDAREHRAVDGRPAVADLDTNMCYIASHRHAYGGVSRPILDGIGYQVSKQLLHTLAVKEPLRIAIHVQLDLSVG